MATEFDESEDRRGDEDRAQLIPSSRSVQAPASRLLAARGIEVWHRRNHPHNLIKDGHYTAGDVIDYIGMCRVHYQLLVLLGITAVVHGMDTTIFAFVPIFAGCSLHLPVLMQTVVSVVYLGGVFCGSLIFGLMSDYAGRKMAMLSCIVLLTMVSSMALLSNTDVLLCTIRYLSGFAMGGMVVRTAWMLECLPARKHQVALYAMVFLWKVGMMLAIPLLQATQGHWPYLVMGIHVPLVPVILCFLLMPESPRYLCERRLFSDAMYSLSRLARDQNIVLPSITLVTEEERTSLHNAGSPIAENSIDGAQEHHKERRKTPLAEMLQRGDRLKTTILLAIAWFTIQFCFFGHNVATVEWFAVLQAKADDNRLYVSPDTLPMCVVFTWEDYVAILLISACALPGLLLLMTLMSKLGRRRGLVWSSIAGAVVLVFAFIPGLGRVGITLILSGQRAAVSAAVQILWIYTAEIYPTHLRGLANGLLLAVGLLGAMVSPFVGTELLVRSPLLGIIVVAVAFIVAAVSSHFLPVENYGVLAEE